MFAAGRTAFHHAVVGDGCDLLVSCPQQQLLTLIDLLIDECDVDIGRARQGITRTIGTALIDVVDDATRQRLIDALQFPDGSARARAQLRAERRIAASSELQAVLRQIVCRAT